jgi:hypothetical protein
VSRVLGFGSRVYYSITRAIPARRRAPRRRTRQHPLQVYKYRANDRSKKVPKHRWTISQHTSTLMYNAEMRFVFNLLFTAVMKFKSTVHFSKEQCKFFCRTFTSIISCKMNKITEGLYEYKLTGQLLPLFFRSCPYY